MANRDRPPKTEGERTRAVQRLSQVVTERRRLRDQQTMAMGTSGEARVGVSLRAVDDQVTTRERWQRVDEQRD